MFKFMGRVLMSVSVLFIFTKNLITEYCTYRFLLYITETIETMKLQCMIGKSYNPIIPIWENNIFIAESAKEKVKIFLDSIGKRNKKEEIEFLNTYYSIFAKQAEEHRYKFETNKKSDITAAAGICAIVILILI